MTTFSITILNNTFTYQLEYNQKFNEWRVAEYKNGTFYSNAIETRSKGIAESVLENIKKSYKNFVVFN
jgi:hypothetical protein